MKVLIINGPNLNLTGSRETAVYGKISFEDILHEIRSMYPEMTIDHFQSNIEGELINHIQSAGKGYDGIILNAGGYTHTSVAIGDAVAAVNIPVVEVHMSHVFSREPFRHISHISASCNGSISGFGPGSYLLGVEALRRKSEKFFLPKRK